MEGRSGRGAEEGGYVCMCLCASACVKFCLTFKHAIPDERKMRRMSAIQDSKVALSTADGRSRQLMCFNGSAGWKGVTWGAVALAMCGVLWCGVLCSFSSRHLHLSFLLSVSFHHPFFVDV